MAALRQFGALVVLATLVGSSAVAVARRGSSPKDPFSSHPGQPPSLTLVPDRPAGGTQGGRWFRDQQGHQFFGKHYQGNEPRLISENLVNQIYRLFRISAPCSFLARHGGRPMLFSPELKGRASDLRAMRRSDLKNGFVVDAWLANWDVLGLEFDNVLVEGRKAHRIDNGGATVWRAQGAPKAFPREVSELQSMRTPWYPAGQVFGALNDGQVAKQIRSFAASYQENAGRIRKLVLSSGLPRVMANRIWQGLRGRAEWLMTDGLGQLERGARGKRSLPAAKGKKSTILQHKS